MAPYKLTDSEVLAIENRMKEKSRGIGTVKPTLRVGEHVRISREMMRFAKGSEQNYTTDIFKIENVIYRTPRPVYVLEDLNQPLIEGQFYGEELTPVRVTERTEYKINNILDEGVRHSIREYSKDLDSWVPASSVREI
jgi:hypothetical protein